MIVLIPMAGAGSRFAKEGYKIHKPAIPTTDIRTGKKVPMVICATNDIPNIQDSKIIYIDRDFHKSDNVEDEILKYYQDATFISLSYLTKGQASTCLLAKDLINNDEDLFIAGCDNGMVYNHDAFLELTKQCDVIVFTYRNDYCVLEKPNAYGWVKVDEKNNITGISVKKSISDNPMNDHAIVSSFWFKKGSIFVNMAEQMIEANDKINNEFYVDQVIKYVLKNSYKAKVFEITKYLGWGTPTDYENYENTIKYWADFVKKEQL